jgi:putative transcriptional regulator
VKGFVQRHPVLLLLAGALLGLAVFPRLIERLKAGAHGPALAPGTLLVARPDGVGSTFDKTVVLLLEAGGERTWGLVLNRVATDAGEPLPQGVDRWGGPVSPAHRITLVPEAAAPPGARRVLEGVAWYRGPREAGGALTFSGVAAWAPGQLEEELAQGAWWPVPGSARAVFTPPASLWAEHAARHL